METNKPNNTEDLAFLEEEANSGLQFKDILFLVLRNIHWFILFAAIGGGLAYYKVKGEERVYASSTTIMLKSGNNAGTESLRSSALLNEFTSRGATVSTIQNEIMIIKSQTLMENVVRKLHLNTKYSYTTRLAKRNKTLYNDRPVEVLFPDANEQLNVSFVVTPKDATHAELSFFQGREDSPSMTINIGEMTNTPVGKVIINYTWYYNDFFNGIGIQVRQQPVAQVATQYRNAVSVVRDDEKNSIRLKLNH